MHPGFEIGAVYLCREPVDFRKSIGGLSALVEETFGVSPLAGGLFLFVNRRYNRLKILYWHRRGFCLWYQRLEQERYAWVPKAWTGESCAITARELGWLLEGFDPWAAKANKTLNYQCVT